MTTIASSPGDLGPGDLDPGDLEPIETASTDELRSLQLQRLQWSLRHAYENVPHYRGAFDAAGVHPDDCKELADLAKFPFTAKADLRENYPFGMFAVPREQVARVHASSGTTGRATVVGYTHTDLDTWATVMARSIRAAGGRPGHILHNAYGYGLFTGGLGAHYGAEKLGCTVVPVSGGMTERQVTLIRDFRPDVIMVTPSYMLAIVDEMERQGLDPAQCSLKYGIFGAEPWTNEMRTEMEARAGLDATDIYGLSEVMGPGVAQECVETKDGLHVWEDHFYPEVIDPETGEVRPDGEPGELVFTSLTKQAMPVIRYRTRDLTRLLPGTARTMRRMEKITGRTDDMIILRGVNLFPTQIEELILRTPALSPHFQLHLSRRGRMDAMAVHVERRADATPEDAGAAGVQLTTLIKNTIGVSTEIVVTEPESIERSLGKMRRIIDERPPDRPAGGPPSWPAGLVEEPGWRRPGLGVEDGAASPAALGQARVEQDLQVPADRTQAQAGQRDQLGGALRGVQQDQHPGPARADERGQRGGHRGLARLGQHSCAWVDQRVPVRLVPGGPALTRGYRDEQQLSPGDVARRVVDRVDLQPAVAQPPGTGPHAVQRGGPAPGAELGRPGQDVGFEDAPARGPVRPHAAVPHPLQQIGQPGGQVRPPQLVRHRAAQRDRQVRGHPLRGGGTDLGQLGRERLLAVAQRGGREHVGDPAPSQGRTNGAGHQRVARQALGIRGQVGVQPGLFAGVGRLAPMQHQQARGRLGQRGDHEPAGGEGVGADDPVAHSFASTRNSNSRARWSLRLRWCAPTASCSPSRSSGRCSGPARSRWRRRRSAAWPWPR